MKHEVVCTGRTGNIFEDILRRKLGKEKLVINVTRLKSRPLGGD
jgi:methylglyoxal synthase